MVSDSSAVSVQKMSAGLVAVNAFSCRPGKQVAKACIWLAEIGREVIVCSWFLSSDSGTVVTAMFHQRVENFDRVTRFSVLRMDINDGR
jgi:hypothetical protein